MKITFKAPLKVAAGAVSSIAFQRLTLANMLEIARVGDVLSAEAQGTLLERFSKAVDANGEPVAITKADVLNGKGIALGTASASVLTRLTAPSNGFPGEEKITAELIADAALVKLAYPVVATVNGKQHTVRLLEFQCPNYGLLEGFVTNTVAGHPKRILEFIVGFGRIADLPSDEGEAPVTDALAGRIDAADASRIAESIIDPFVVGQIGSFDLSEE